MPNRIYDTIIVGAGFTGIGAAIKLTEAGVDDFVILERSNRVGGTWRDNTYPGAACDVPSLLYSYSFVKNPSWSRAYSPADEICRHIEDMVSNSGLEPKIEFGVEVNELVFDETQGVWTLKTKGRKKFQARTVVMASGPLPDHKWPDIRGLDTYEGHKIHSARWDHDYDFTGKRVAVIGTGASAVQIIPELVKQAEFVKVFQRTPGWVLPRLDGRHPRCGSDAVRQSARRSRACATGTVLGPRDHCDGNGVGHPADGAGRPAGQGTPAQGGQGSVVAPSAHPGLQAGLQADAGLQRLLPRAAARQLQAHRLADRHRQPVGIRTSDGIEHHFDCIVFATGYDVHLTGPPYPVTGMGGRSLSQEWASGAQAYKSINAHGYPNLFLMTGPNSGPGHNSLLVYVEGQLDYAVRGITTILRENLRYLDVRADVQRRYNERIQKRLTKTTWMSGCSSWYLTADGFNASMYPGFATQYLRQMRDFRFGDYDAVAREAHTGIGTRSSA